MSALKAWWVGKAWPWLQKNWKWLLLPVGILLAGSKLLRRAPEVVAPELIGAAEEKAKAEEEASRQRMLAEHERQEALKQIREEHAEAVKNLTDEQKSRVTELENNPEELNDFLKGVGKSVRQK